MDLNKAKILLKKINTLNESLSLDNGSIASIERDLMLSYVRQLYEAYLDKANPMQAGNSKDDARTAATNTLELEMTDPHRTERPVKESQHKPEPPKRKYSPPKIIEIADPPSEPLKATQPTQNPVPVQAKALEGVADKKTVPSPNPVTRSGKSHAPNPKIKALFDQREAKELSEKLSLRPIKDLTKGLSINDRLLYTNDLFKKDTSLFNNTLKALNEMPDMETAQTYLEEQAAKYHWDDGEKADVAMDFIKHVRRRYV